MIFDNYIKGEFNPFKLNSILFDSFVYEKQIPQDFGNRFLDTPIFRVLYIYLKQIVGAIRNIFVIGFYRLRYYRSFIDNKVVFFLPTPNNLQSLQGVIDEICNVKKNTLIIDADIQKKYFPFLRIMLVSLFYIPQFLKEIKKLSYAQRRITLYYADFFIFDSGYVWFYQKLLSKSKPECVIFANDHIFDKKALALVCESLNVRTLYVQHASVSFAFPELHFTYSFLDGLDSLEKYTYNGKKIYGDAILLGAVRYDKLSQLRKTRKERQFRNCIGISINAIDDNIKVNDLCNFLLEKFPSVVLKIRSHPSMVSHPFIFDNTERIIYTCAIDETIIDYFDSIDIQVSGDSGVHLDAIIAGVETIAFNMTLGKYGDNYDFIKNGIIRFINTSEEIYKVISNFYDSGYRLPINIDYVKRYDESYGKRYAGTCHNIIADFIISGYSISNLSRKYGLEKRCDGTNYYLAISETQ